jgi:hypothetical protein
VNYYSSKTTTDAAQQAAIKEFWLWPTISI